MKTRHDLVTAATDHLTVEVVEAGLVSMTVDAGNKKAMVRLLPAEAKALAAQLCSAVEEMT